MCRVNNFIRVGVLLIGLIGFSTSVNAQIYDLVEDYVKKKVTEKIEGYLMDAASNFWDNLVDNSARNSIKEKSRELAYYYPANLDTVFPTYNPEFVYSGGKINMEMTFSKIKPIILKKFHDDLESGANIPFNNMGAGYLGIQNEKFILDRAENAKIRDFSDVLNNETTTYIREKLTEKQQKKLLEDLNVYPALIPVLNANIATVDYYLKLRDITQIDAQELLYWAQFADKISKRLPKKNKFIEVPSLKFVSNNKTIAIYNENVLLANYYPTSNHIIIISPDFLCLLPQADYKYTYEEINFTTDALGRIKEISFWGDKKLNKTSAKSNVKLKDIMLATNVHSKDNLYSIVLKDFNLPFASGFLVDVKDDKELKDKVKEYKKEVKKVLKENPKAKGKLKLTYSDHSNIPSNIEFSIGNISLSNKPTKSIQAAKSSNNHLTTAKDRNLRGNKSSVQNISRKQPSTKEKKENLLKKKVYADLGFSAPSNIGVYASIGGYVKGINIEGSLVYGLQESREFYFTGTLPLGTIQHSSNTYSAVEIDVKVGYGIPCGRRVQLTPQLGINPVFIHSANEITATLEVASVLSAIGSLRAYFAITPNIGITLIPEYKFRITRPSETVNAMMEMDSRIKSWLEGVNGKLGITFSF